MEPNKSGLPLSGKSMLEVIRSEDSRPIVDWMQREFYFSHEGNRGFRSGNFKVVSAAETRQGDGRWRLHDLSVDRAEMVDLAEQYPEKFRELVEKWETMDERFAEESKRP